MSDVALRRLPFDDCWIAMHFEMATLRFAVHLWASKGEPCPFVQGFS